MEKIKFNDIQVFENEIKAVNKVIEHKQFIMGPEVYELEEKLAAFINAKYCVSCSSGTDALILSLMALGIGRFSAALTTPFTFVATANALRMVGTVVKFVDIEKDTFFMDASKIGYHADVIIPVDIFGGMHCLDELDRCPDKKIVLDAAQSFGSAINMDDVDMMTTSFFPSKPLGCWGDGGAVFTNDEHLYYEMISIREHGKSSYLGKVYCDKVGTNARMDTIQAAVLLEKLKVYPDIMERRQWVAERYTCGLESDIELPVAENKTWSQFSFLSKNREKLTNALEEKSIPFRMYYEYPLHKQQSFYRHDVSLPVADEVCERVISLPMHPYLTNDQIDYICEVVRRVEG